MADVLSTEGVEHEELNKNPSSKVERYTNLLHLLRLCRNTILETTDQLNDIAGPSGYDSHMGRKREGKTEVYRPIPPELLDGVQTPDPMAGISVNWKVIMQFYKSAEKEFLQRIDSKIAETDSFRQVVSIYCCTCRYCVYPTLSRIRGVESCADILIRRTCPG